MNYFLLVLLTIKIQMESNKKGSINFLCVHAIRKHLVIEKLELKTSAADLSY